jgi:DNA-binding NtrC family response regulator
MATDRKANLFPAFMASAYEQLRGHVWPGNLREFERVANDLYWDLDEGAERSIDGEDVRRAIDIFKIGAVQAQPSLKDAADRRVLEDVQAALRDENFVLKNAKERLSRYKLGGYESLKRYLRENQGRLDSDVLADSKIKRVLAKSSGNYTG